MSVSVNATVAVQTGGLDAMIQRLMQIETITAAFAAKIAARAQELAPEETGDLKGTIHAVLNGATAVIVAGEGLPDMRALAQEFGFHHHSTGAFVQNAYLLPALLEYADAYIAAIREIFA